MQRAAPKLPLGVSRGFARCWQQLQSFGGDPAHSRAAERSHTCVTLLERAAALRAFFGDNGAIEKCPGNQRLQGMNPGSCLSGTAGPVPRHAVQRPSAQQASMVHIARMCCANTNGMWSSPKTPSGAMRGIRGLRAIRAAICRRLHVTVALLLPSRPALPPLHDEPPLFVAAWQPPAAWHTAQLRGCKSGPRQPPSSLPAACRGRGRRTPGPRRLPQLAGQDAAGS